MTEKTAVRGERFFCCAGEIIRKNGVWALLGALMELGSSEHTAAPASSALAIGLPRGKWAGALVGGIFGALLRGFPQGLYGLAGLSIALTSRLIPDAENVYIRAAVRGLCAMLACFVPRSAAVDEPSELLRAVIAAVGAGVFAAIVCLISERTSARSFDITSAGDCAFAGILSALGFMALGALDYPLLNVGRMVFAAGLLLINARRGAVYAAVLGFPALFGLCAAGEDIGAMAAVMAAAVFISAALSRRGRITQAAGFVFIVCAGSLLGGIGDSGWSGVIEAVIAGAVFALAPQERLRAREGDFSDSEVASLLRERLSFAADALGGIGAGITAAHESLDRRYALNPAQAAERAAERSCRNCPKSMTCWGENYELFRAEFARLMEIARRGEPLDGRSMSGGCAAICASPELCAQSVEREYRRYLSAAADEARIAELRRLYTDWLSGVRDILKGLGNAGEADGCVGKSRAAEKSVSRLLRESGMTGAECYISRDRQGKLHIEAYSSKEPKVDAEYLGGLLSEMLGRELEKPEISFSGGRCRLVAGERQALHADIGAFQFCREQNRVCGDCYESFSDGKGALYIVLSDGMGSGSRARVDSALACSVLSRLIKSGIPLTAALETVNTSLMVKSADESFATLDICKIDLNSGECAVYKAGAATTYIKSADRLIRASLSSPPAGAGGHLTVPAQQFKVSAGDVIVMMTDGCAPDEVWLSRELSKRSSAKELSERIARAARSAENGRRDDISVIAVSVSA